MALSLLSGLSVPELAQAVSRQEGRPPDQVPGIGKKTAERLLLGSRASWGGSCAAGDRCQRRAGRHPQALIALGYREGRRRHAEGAAGRRGRQRRHQAGAEEAV
jgi:Holliday junction DNA helicase RuvA